MTEADLKKTMERRSRWQTQCGGGKPNLETSRPVRALNSVTRAELDG
jgi:hypothetical protein